MAAAAALTAWHQHIRSQHSSWSHDRVARMYDRTDDATAANREYLTAEQQHSEKDPR